MHMALIREKQQPCAYIILTICLEKHHPVKGQFSFYYLIY